MELKNVFIDAEKSLGNITFAGAGRESQQRINGGIHAVISLSLIHIYRRKHVCGCDGYH